jgi:hypothetical protein
MLASPRPSVLAVFYTGRQGCALSHSHSTAGLTCKLHGPQLASARTRLLCCASLRHASGALRRVAALSVASGTCTTHHKVNCCNCTATTARPTVLLAPDVTTKLHRNLQFHRAAANMVGCCRPIQPPTQSLQPAKPPVTDAIRKAGRACSTQTSSAAAMEGCDGGAHQHLVGCISGCY